MPAFDSKNDKQLPPKKKKEASVESAGMTNSAVPSGDDPVKHYLERTRRAEAASVQANVLEPEEEQRIAQRLRIMDEYNREHSNLTEYTSLVLDDTWLKMKDVRLEALSGPLSADLFKDNVLKVPPAVLPIVRQAQQDMVNLEAIFRAEWTNSLETAVSHKVSNRMDETVQAAGKGLAEVMVALSASANPYTTDDEALSLHEEAGVLKVLAGDALDLMGEVDAIQLLDDSGLDEISKVLSSSGQSSETTHNALREKLTSELAKRLKIVSDQDPALHKGISALTKKAVRGHRENQRNALILSSIIIGHAAGKVKRFYDKIMSEGSKTMITRSRILMKTLMDCRETLKHAQRKLNPVVPGVLENLGKTATGAVTMYHDTVISTAIGKTVTGLSRAVVAGVHKVQDMRRAGDTLLHSTLMKHLPHNGDRLPDEKKTELTVILIPLDNAADQIKSVTKPMQSAADALVRVKRHEHVRGDTSLLTVSSQIKEAQHLSAGDRQAGMVLGALVNTALGRTGPQKRLDAKVKKVEDEFFRLAGHIRDVLPYIRQQLEDTFTVNVPLMKEKYGGYPGVETFLNATERLAHEFGTGLIKLEAAVYQAQSKDIKNMPEVAKKMADASQHMVHKAERLADSIRLWTSRSLEIEFAYDSYEKNMIADLMDLTVELGGGSHEKERKVLSYLQSLLGDEGREFLHRENDPHNAILNAALEQEYTNLLQHARRKAPTVSELMAQSGTIREELIKKGTQKTVSAGVSLGLSAVAGFDVSLQIGMELVNKVAERAMQGKALSPIELYAGYKSLEGIRKATRPGQRPQDYAYQKLLSRKLVKLLLSATSLIPSVFMLPVAAPIAIYGAATRPERFLKDAASILPVTLAFAGGYQAFRSTADGVGHIQYELKKREIVSMIEALNESLRPKQASMGAMTGETFATSVQQDMREMTQTSGEELEMAPDPAPLEYYDGSIKEDSAQGSGGQSVKEPRSGTDILIDLMATHERMTQAEVEAQAAMDGHQVMDTHTGYRVDKARKTTYAKEKHDRAVDKSDAIPRRVKRAAPAAPGAPVEAVDATNTSRPAPRKTERFYSMPVSDFKAAMRALEHVNTLGKKANVFPYTVLRETDQGSLTLHLSLDSLIETFDPATDRVTDCPGGGEAILGTINRYLSASQEDIDKETIKIAHEESQDLYKRAYPVHLNMQSRIDKVIQDEINRLTGGTGYLHGIKITPDTEITVEVEDAVDQYANAEVKLKTFTTRHKFTIRELATGQHIRKTSIWGNFYMDLPHMKMRELMPLFTDSRSELAQRVQNEEWSSGIPWKYPFPISKKIEAEIDESLETLSTEESKAARAEINRRFMISGLGEVLKKVRPGSEEYNAVDKVIKGQIKPHIINFYDYELQHVIALPLEGEAKYMLVNTKAALESGKPPYVIVDMMDPQNASKSAKVYEWIKGSIPVEGVGKHQGKLEGQWDQHTMGWEGTRVHGPRGMKSAFVTYYNQYPTEGNFSSLRTIPYTFRAIEFGVNGENVGKELARIELQTVKLNADTLTYTEGEHTWQKVLTGAQWALLAASVATMVFTGGATAALLSLSISLLSYAVDYAQTQVEDDPLIREQMMHEAIILNLALSVPGDIADATKLINTAGKAAKLGARIQKLGGKLAEVGSDISDAASQLRKNLEVLTEKAGTSRIPQATNITDVTDIKMPKKSGRRPAERLDESSGTQLTPGKPFAQMAEHEKIATLTQYGMDLPESKELARYVGHDAVKQSVRAPLQSQYTGHSKQRFAWGSEELEKANIQQRARTELKRYQDLDSTLDTSVNTPKPFRGRGDAAAPEKDAAEWIVGSSKTLSGKADEATEDMLKILEEFRGIDVTDFAQLKKLHERLYRIEPGQQARIFRTVDVPHFTSSFVGEAYFKKFLEKLKLQRGRDDMGELLYEGVIRAHPFPDANGRLARTLYALEEIKHKRFRVPDEVMLENTPRMAKTVENGEALTDTKTMHPPEAERHPGRVKGINGTPSPVPATGTHVHEGILYVDGQPVARHSTMGNENQLIRISANDSSPASETAVLTMHGMYRNGAEMVDAPENLKLSFMTPHDTYLADPGIPFVLNEPMNYNVFVDITGQTYKVSKFKRPDLNMETRLEGYDWEKDASGQWFREHQALDNPDVITTFDTHGVGPERPAVPQAGSGKAPTQIRNYEYWHYEHDKLEEVARAVQDNATLAAQTGSGVTKADVLLLDSRVLDPKFFDVQPKFQFKDLMELHRQGKLLNSEGKPYKRLIMSHCRNQALGTRYGVSDPNITYSYSRTEALDDNFTKGMASKGMQKMEVYEDTVDLHADGTYTTARRFVGTLYTREGGSSEANASGSLNTASTSAEGRAVATHGASTAPPAFEGSVVATRGTPTAPPAPEGSAVATRGTFTAPPTTAESGLETRQFRQRPKPFNEPEPVKSDYPHLSDQEFAQEYDDWAQANHDYYASLYQWERENSRFVPTRSTAFGTAASGNNGLTTDVIPPDRMAGIIDADEEVFKRYDVGETKVDGFSLVSAFDKDTVPSQSGVKTVVFIGHGYLKPEEISTTLPAGFETSFAVPAGYSYQGPVLRNYAKQFDTYNPHSTVSTKIGAEGAEPSKTLTKGGAPNEHTSRKHITGLSGAETSPQGPVPVNQHFFRKHESDPVVAVGEATLANRKMASNHVDFLSVRDPDAEKNLNEVLETVEKLNAAGANYEHVRILTCRNVEFDTVDELRDYLAAEFKIDRKQLDLLNEEELNEFRTYNPDTGSRVKRSAGKGGKYSITLYEEQAVKLEGRQLSPKIVTQIGVGRQAFVLGQDKEGN